MFKQIRLWANILLVIGAAIILAITTLTLVSLHNLKTVSRTAEESELRQLAAMVQTQIREEVGLAEALGVLVAEMPEVQTRFAAGDRDWLVEQFHPPFEALARDFGAVQFQFHTAPAMSFLRLHMLEKFGDDLSSFRQSVVDTNRDREPHRGLEVGVAGLGARGVVPILQAGRHLGSVEFGMSFGQPFFDDFKANYGVEAALYILRDGEVETFASTHAGQPFLGPDALRAAFAGEPQIAEIDSETTPFAAYAEMVPDYSGKPFGVLEVAMDRTPYVAVLDKTRMQAMIIGVLVAFFSIGISLITAHAITKRIRRLADEIDRVTNGDLSSGEAIDGNDELADLARALDGMRGHLNALVTGVETSAFSVHAASREIAQAIDGQAATSSQMSASVAEITSTMEELSASSTHIAEYSESVVAIAGRTYDDSLRGSDAMQHLVEKMRRIGEDNQTALNEILELGTRSKEISKIMQIIDTVADQTKLIAFNAALEASSAGEAGKRFGVVAAEIRRLADSVTASTGEITGKVAEIQESINRLVISSEKGSTGIQQGIADSAGTADILQAIVEAASETSTSAQQISLSTQQQRTASSQVVIALREIVAASSETAGAVRQIADIARDMSELSSALQSRLDQFVLNETHATSAAPGESSLS
ncbi:methyl-accepting chemotaxis protein [Thiocapsa marina]|uniref:Methyl-accepting chemotaxis sensory transducer n=1 Tax=Thiocapsa marina 5811 TaxID=768671 RepID=F9U753_9GAMM|nr:methyl-accepting chemotaxis protein [Thiocapsa marina]EGV20079.1 methyl-accepting chemotaxis sensory transducer [Thiocapsa marina 5811]